jgi:hypothetical protein
VNINHPKGSPSSSRDYQDRLGQLRNVTADGSGLRGDLHANPKHALFEQLAWDAENAPENVGLSHNIEGKTSRRDGKTIVEEIVKVHSVDLVADPATARGLFEQTEHAAPEPPKVENAADFAAVITGQATAGDADSFAETVTGQAVSGADKERFNEALGIGTRRANKEDAGKEFVEAIT